SRREVSPTRARRSAPTARASRFRTPPSRVINNLAIDGRERWCTLPRVQTFSSSIVLIALTFCVACESSPESTRPAPASAGGAGGQGPASSGARTSTGSSCSSPPANNPAGCPANYSFALAGQPCSMPELECWYPGVGDTLPNGCNATALLRCTTQFSDGG